MITGIYTLTVYNDKLELRNTAGWSGKLHSLFGFPAIIHADGTKEYWVNDKRHRDNGLPAVEYADGTKEYWVNGKQITEEESKELMIIEMARLYELKVKSINNRTM